MKGRSPPRMPRPSSHSAGVRSGSAASSVCGFSTKPTTRPASSRRTMLRPPTWSRAACGQHGDGHVGLVLMVRVDELAEVHPVELVAGKNHHLGGGVFGDIADLLAHGVGGALVPVGRLVGLLGGQHLDEALVEGVELVGVGDVAVEADAEELGEDVDAVAAAVDAVADGEVDEAVLAGHGHGRLAAQLRERVEARAAAAAEDEAQDVRHGETRGCVA